jgi:hypothetical protein
VPVKSKMKWGQRPVQCVVAVVVMMVVGGGGEWTPLLVLLLSVEVEAISAVTGR